MIKKIEDDLRKALKMRQTEEVKTLRLFLAACKNKEIELRPKKQELNDEVIVEVLKGEIKKRKESIEMFEKGKREDLVSIEKKEMEILEKYLPPQMTDEKLREFVKKIKEEVGAGKRSDFGKLMGAVMKEVKGKADGARVKKMVDEELNQ
ncbi:glutamyl-tRNA amidotransferase [bacterium (Candidatus Moisslbacteria) CG12_big_fil_rev_8_21_14_0_65_36_11]|nr:GatB/YqeY domain-containing protein [Candidatus Kuenenbacteria bacterium]OIP76335.1 MAG: hypothetical protein AUK09_02285 [Parcubacteria group bacterium CG2_30_36_38]PIV46206.1 MAG: glutamyl-tRNA amidotransferase [bacterium (Candidatus Moisslbacteria) CG02_land_8_20_14_3_00_36_53]PIW67830.1 MAG: glutamyl-tRNA amidotransferase [bacterium (Candidatus Moisslbacteria) CG12_big_fil_rev_8_21_14_0_65_36_11]PIZ90482.1 MAG: glutamyl-tRNA amidotransferase [bacterium (Candidatus Moisslbacteria) CG_4_10